ncbi:MAG: hypothetical protein PWQ55_414 [Chloroflexota bacterium]|nr:hypothetical protein [Chloroflexota bacterium]
MFAEIKKVAQTVLTDQKYLKLRKKILYIFIAFVALILVDRFALPRLANLNDFYVSLARTRMVFQGNLSAYENEVNRSSENIRTLGLTLGNIRPFSQPMYALLFYAPFIFVPDFYWALALWLAVNQIMCYFTFSMLLDLFDVKLDEKFKALGALALFATYFTALNVLNTNLSMLHIFLLVAAFYQIRKKRFIFAGILFGLTTFNLFSLLLPMLMFFLLNFTKGRGVVNLWMAITVGLLSMALVIFDMRWILEMLKVWVMQPDFYPLISYRSYIAGVFPRIDSNLVTLWPLLILFWLVYEWLRSPKETFEQEFWLMGLAFTLNPLINMWDSLYPTIGYLVVFIYTVSLWYDRSTPKFRIFVAALYGLVLILLPVVQMILQKQVFTYQNVYTYNLIATLLLLFNLYWVRLWVMNPYYSVNQLDEY